jgi:hypothetical protein
MLRLIDQYVCLSLYTKHMYIAEISRAKHYQCPYYALTINCSALSWAIYHQAHCYVYVQHEHIAVQYSHLFHANSHIIEMYRRYKK